MARSRRVAATAGRPGPAPARAPRRKGPPTNPHAGGNNRYKTRKRIADAQRQAVALSLKLEGQPDAAIARALGVSGAHANRIVNAGLDVVRDKVATLATDAITLLMARADADRAATFEAERLLVSVEADLTRIIVQCRPRLTYEKVLKHIRVCPACRGTTRSSQGPGRRCRVCAGKGRVAEYSGVNLLAHSVAETYNAALDSLATLVDRRTRLIAERTRINETVARLHRVAKLPPGEGGDDESNVGPFMQVNIAIHQELQHAAPYAQGALGQGAPPGRAPTPGAGVGEAIEVEVLPAAHTTSDNGAARA